MKRTIYLITVIVIMFSASACQRETGARESMGMETEASEPVHRSAHSDRIKDATLLIKVESIQQYGAIQAYDMATLVQYRGETYLVTHNHYGDMLQDGNIVQLRDADNHKILSLYGSEFKSLIVYQDPATLVLRIPDGLTDTLTPAILDHQPELQPGDIVQVTYRGGSSRDKVEILDAVIEKISVSGVTPVYRLRSLDGQLLSPGDSGGGVWYGETFVGNNWSVIVTYDQIEQLSGTANRTGETQTNSSYAAVIPEMFQE